MGEEPKMSHPQKAAFLGAYAETGSIKRAAKAAGINRRTHQRWAKEDPEYAELFAEAKEEACDALEEEARRRATEGVRRLKFDKHGEPLEDPDTGEPYVEHQYSDTLLIFLLKGNNPAKFGDRVEQTHRGDPDAPIELRGILDEIRQNTAHADLERERAVADSH